MNNIIEKLCLSLLTKCKTLQTTKQLQAFVCKNGLENHPLLAGKILLHCVLTISGALDHGRRLLSFSPRPDAFMYNTLIRGLAESDSPGDAVHVFVEMRQKSISPNLPRLKCLWLVNVTSYGGVANLLLGCPVLEKFVWKGRSLPNSCISSSSLKFLEVGGYCQENLQVDATNLQSFQVRGALHVKIIIDITDLIISSACILYAFEPVN